MSSFNVSVVTQVKKILEQEAGYLRLRTSEGDIGILPNHASFVAELSMGKMEIESPNKDRRNIYFLSGGFLEISNNQVTIIADEILPIEEIDIDKTLLEHNTIHLILGYANAKKFIDNINAQSLYKATSELEKIDCPNRELTKDEFMAHMEKMYEWYLTSNRCLSKEVNYRYDMIKMKLSELGLDSNFNVV